jgi:hypothetical protein
VDCRGLQPGGIALTVTMVVAWRPSPGARPSCRGHFEELSVSGFSSKPGAGFEVHAFVRNDPRRAGATRRSCAGRGRCSTWRDRGVRRRATALKDTAVIRHERPDVVRSTCMPATGLDLLREPRRNHAAHHHADPFDDDEALLGRAKAPGTC